MTEDEFMERCRKVRNPSMGAAAMRALKEDTAAALAAHIAAVELDRDLVALLDGGNGGNA